MTIEENLLIRIYAQQQVYFKRILEMVCALKENLTEEQTGLLFAMVDADAQDVYQSLVAELINNRPDHTELSAIHGLPDEIINNWIDKATDEIIKND